MFHSDTSTTQCPVFVVASMSTSPSWQGEPQDRPVSARDLGFTGYLCPEGGKWENIETWNTVAVDLAKHIRSQEFSGTIVVLLHKDKKDRLRLQFELVKHLSRLLSDNRVIRVSVIGFAKALGVDTVIEWFEDWLAEQNADNDCVRTLCQRIDQAGGLSKLFISDKEVIQLVKKHG